MEAVSQSEEWDSSISANDIFKQFLNYAFTVKDDAKSYFQFKKFVRK